MDAPAGLPERLGRNADIQRGQVARRKHRLAAQRWEQDRLGVKPRHTWEEAVVRWLQETKHKATHEGEKAKPRWLDPPLAGRELQQIDRTVIDHIKYLRERKVSTGTANRYLALIRAILRRACNEPKSSSYPGAGVGGGVGRPI